MTTVLETNRYLSSILELDELLEKIIDKIMELLGAERCILYLYSEDSTREDKLEIKTVRDSKKTETDLSDVSKDILMDVLKNKKSVIIDDEYLARENLKMLLDEFCPEVEVIGSADSVAWGELALDKSWENNLILIDGEEEHYIGDAENIVSKVRKAKDMGIDMTVVVLPSDSGIEHKSIEYFHDNVMTQL